MENTASKKIDDAACCNTNNCTTMWGCPCCAKMRNCCWICKIGKLVFWLLIFLALLKFVCGGMGYHMRWGMMAWEMWCMMDKWSMMMSGSMKNHKSEKSFFQKWFDRDDTTTSTGTVTTGSTK